MRKFLLAFTALLGLGVVFSLAQNAPSANPPVGIAGAYLSSALGCTPGQACWVQTDSDGNLKTVGVAGGVAQNVNITQVASSTLTSTVPVASLATSSIIGAVSLYQIQTIQGTNFATIASTPGNVYALQLCNSSSVGLFIKIYDAAVTQTVGTATPTGNLMIPASGCRPALEGPISFTSGIGIAFSAAKALMGSSAVGPDDIMGLVMYKAQ